MSDINKLMDMRRVIFDDYRLLYTDHLNKGYRATLIYNVVVFVFFLVFGLTQMYSHSYVDAIPGGYAIDIGVGFWGGLSLILALLMTHQIHRASRKIKDVDFDEVTNRLKGNIVAFLAMIDTCEPNEEEVKMLLANPEWHSDVSLMFADLKQWDADIVKLVKTRG